MVLGGFKREKRFFKKPKWAGGEEENVRVAAVVGPVLEHFATLLPSERGMLLILLVSS